MSSVSLKKILIMSTFPIERAHHGGSKRVKAIVEQYRGRFASVKFVAVFSRFAYPIHALSDIPVSLETDRVIKKNLEFEDVICGRAVYDDAKVRERVVKLLTAYRPDIIQIEQIYPYLGLKRILAEMPNYKPRIILSSHNIESQMKRETYERIGKGLDILDELEATETELVRLAEFVATVGAQDAKVFKQMGAKKVVVAPNGISPIAQVPRDTAFWRGRFAKKDFRLTYGYVSSAHLPNWHGFLEVVGNAMGFLEPDVRMVLAGSLSDYVVELYKKPRTIAEVTFWQRVYPAGRLTEARLAGLLGALDVILLPITSGGGSNLKTAEAILSGKKIVGTSYAFREYEQFMDFPNVWVADDAAAFRAAMQAAAITDYVELTAEQHQAVRVVLWENCLHGLINEATAL